MVKFCIDRIVDSKAYPNGAKLEAKPFTPEWRKFSVNWPYSEPFHFLEYLNLNHIPYQLVEWTQADRQSIYPISISFFDFGVNWFEVIPVMIREKLRTKSLTLCFFYSEGDNPERIQAHIEAQAITHDIKPEMIQFVSANSSAANIERFHHFVDDECLYQHRNTDLPVEFHTQLRNKKFTALVRTHKWWRATTMARIWSQGFHKDGYFSYNRDLSVDDKEEDNPIEIDSFENLRSNTYDFLKRCPFKSDNLNSDEHNLYATTVREHFEDSYLNVVIETHMDVDQSGGVFLTEKTFKPIKNCQPFIIFGAKGSIQQLRNMGYRTFDHVIDHSYDNIENTTERWDAACQEFERLMTVDLYQAYVSCKDDLLWNQQLFLAPKADRLNRLLESIHNATISKQLY
jgi:hypothetical protein